MTTILVLKLIVGANQFLIFLHLLAKVLEVYNIRCAEAALTLARYSGSADRMSHTSS